MCRVLSGGRVPKAQNAAGPEAMYHRIEIALVILLGRDIGLLRS
jgi:hypothetical protein